MRIVFFGTNKFSATILEALYNNKNCELIGVVSQCDKINARNNKVIFSEVKQFCLMHQIKLLQFEKLNRDGEDILKSLKPDLFVTASYGQIIKQNILDIPNFFTVNVHASLLPKYRGPAPIQAAIYNGDKVTGITIMKTDIGMDTGDIFFEKELEIHPDDTTCSVFSALSTLGADCINEFINNFDYYKDRSMPQDESKASYFPMIKKEDLLLDFNMCAFDLCNKIRAFGDCYLVYKGVRYKILFAVPNDKKGKIGEILACDGKKGLIVGAKDRSIEIVTIQPEGKAKMLALSYMNSNKFILGDIIENT